jgi:uncharacterized protein (DUF983 family)
MSVEALRENMTEGLGRSNLLPALLGQLVRRPGDPAGFLIWCIVIAGMIAVAFVIMRVLGYNPPPWVVHILTIIGVVLVGVIAIIFLSHLL